MATFVQTQDTVQAPATFNGVLSDVTISISLSIETMQIFDSPQPTAVGALTKNAANVPTIVPATWQGESLETSVGGFDFFEDFHVIPRSFVFGNLLSDQSVPFEVFHASRRATLEWTSFVNNAGLGVTIDNLPALPTDMRPFTSHTMTLQVSTIGDPFVDTTLDFVFDTGTNNVPISLQRVILWYLRPEQEFVELLAFLTDIVRAKSGKEKRAALRKNPRQVLQHTFLIEDADRPLFENRLFDFQARQIGMPLWFDNSKLTVAATATDTVITVDDTTLRDYRVGGNAVVITDEDTFDVITIASFTSTTITSSAPLLNAHAVDTEVFPMVTSYVQEKVGGERWPNGLSQLSLALRTEDNDNDLGDLSGWTQYNGKPVVDTGMIVRGTARETFETRQVVVDGLTGIIEQSTPWDGQKRRQPLVLRGQGRAAVWQLRQLAHGLRGKQISFYLPRDFPDMIVNTGLLNVGTAMVIDTVGYTQFVRQRQSKNHVRVTKTDGTEKFREITNSVLAVDGLTETLTITPVWDEDVDVADIEEVTILEEVRLDTDVVRLEFGLDPFVVRMAAPIKTVFE